MMLLVTAMVFSHFLKEGRLEKLSVARPVYVISFMTLLLTLIFFVITPRTMHRFLGKSHAKGIRTTGFSERMDFGSLGSIKLDPTVVMRVEIEGSSPGPFYWRGHTLDFFDGTAWKNELMTRSRIPRTADEFRLAPFEPGSVTGQQIYLEPIDSDLVFGLSQVVGIKTDSYYMMVDGAGNIYMPGKSARRIKYTAYSIISNSFPGYAGRRYLQLPSGSQRVASLAQEVTRGARTSEMKAIALEEYLKRNYEYTLTVSPPPAGVSPIEDFLLKTKKGYCEHYSSAMVLMLRSLGIPARIVTGFFGGDRNTYGGYVIVRKSDAHSWVEAYINGQWKRFDPTPAVAVERFSQEYSLFWDSVKMNWSRYIVGFSSADQRVLFGELKEGFGLGSLAGRLQTTWGIGGRMYAALAAVTVLSLLSLISVYLYFRGRQRRSPLVASYVRIRKALRRKGFAITETSTPGDIAAQSEGLPFHVSLAEYLSGYTRVRFGGQGDINEVLRSADQTERMIKKGRVRHP